MSSATLRQQKILDLVNRKKKVRVSDLTRDMQVSSVTIRKDLNRLEEQNLLRHSHGYATLPDSEDIGERMMEDFSPKMRIARKAAGLVSDGETIMVESGSACALFVRELARLKKDVMVITNSAYIAGFVRHEEGVRITLLGGEYQKDSQAMVGPMVRKNAQSFHVHSFFIGTDGYTDESGFMARDYMRNEAIHDMAAQAAQVIVLTDSSKFSHGSLVRILPERKVDMVITDGEIDDQARVSLARRGIELLEADPA